MMSIDLRINGELIDCFSIVNTGKTNKKEEHLYDVFYNEKKTLISHFRPEGAPILALKALDSLWKNGFLDATPSSTDGSDDVPEPGTGSAPEGSPADAGEHP